MGNFWVGQSGRPARWMRVWAALMGLLFIVSLIFDHDDVGDYVTAVTLCGLMSVTVFAPRGLYDGRFAAWSRRHVVLSAALIVAGMAGCSFVVLSTVFGQRIGVLVGVPAGMAFGAFAAYLDRKRHA